ncbi:MAG: serine/threonine protein kinase [Planctomycetaceae bacterium]|nr:serine/threonine protein kinase [Planctomycetaceae bacterium]
MNTCPSCNIRLTDDELKEGRCLECGTTFESVPDADGPSQNHMQTVDGSALPIDLDSDAIEIDEPNAPAAPLTPGGGMQTVDASQLPSDLDSDAIEVDEDDEAGSAAPEPNYQQTVDSSTIAEFLDSDSIEFDESERAARPPSDGGMQTIDATQLPESLDSDAIELDDTSESVESDAAPAKPNYQQTVDAASLDMMSDSDSLEFDESPAPPPAPPADGGMQTIDAANLPAASNSDSVDFGESAPPTAERAYTQTIDSVDLPAESDTDSIDADSLEEPPKPPPSYNQTVDASQLPANIDSDSVDFGETATPPANPAIGQTVDSTNLDPALDSDSIDGLAANAPDKGTGTVSERIGAQTIDSQTMSGDSPEGGTVSDRLVNATIDSTDISDGGGTVGDRQVAATYDSSVIGDDPAQMNDMWGGDQNAGTTPHMTIKGREAAPKPGSQTLAIKSRSFREIEEQRAFGSAAEYDLMKKLGEGGMGVVYLGRQAAIDRSVAIKMLKPHMAADANQRNKFLTEAVITGDLDHPNIVPIYDLGANDEGALFYAMKCVKGTPWDECIQDKSLTENIEIFMKTCDAVAFGHSRGIIHRDLKPENTMIGGYGEVLVMDWGLALPYGEQFEKIRSITTAASMGGTPAYMAPEMATGPFDKMGPASDVYLLGAILYEIVTGTPPHRGKDVMKCLFAAAKNQIVPTEKTGELVDIALKAMATDIEDRYPTVQDLSDAIRSYQDHSESIVMSVRAGDELEKAKESDSYDAYSRSLFGFEEAYALWDGNDRAQVGVGEAKLAYAASALRKGDFDLGTSLLDQDNPEHSDVAVRIDEARREREIKQQRAQKLKRVVVTLVIGGLIAALIASGVMYSLKSLADAQRELAVKAQVEAEDARADEEKQRIAADAAREEEAKQRKAAVAAKVEAESAREEEEKQRKAAVAAREEEAKQRKAAVAAKIEADEQRDLAEYEAYVALIGLAAAKIDENAFGHARLLLHQCKADLRRWEWGRLMHICNQSVRDFDTGAPVDTIDFAPDGKRFVTGGWNGTARVWNALDGSFVELPHGGLYVQAVAFSPVTDSTSPLANQVATGSNDKQAFLRIWDVKTKQAVKTLVGHTDAVTSVTYSKDGKRLLSTSFDNTARIWDVATGEQLQVLEGHSWWVWDAAFSPDEQSVATTSQDGTALLWNLADGSKSVPFTGHQGPVYSIAFADDGQTVATGGYDKRVLLWKPSDIKPFDYAGLLAGEEPPPPVYRALEGHKAAVRSVAFTSDGELVLSAGHDNTVQVWNAAKGSPIKTLRGHDSWVRSCAFSPNGKWVLSGGYDNHARLWNIEGYEEVRVLRGRVLEGHQDAIMGLAFSRDGRKIVTASRDRTAKSWDTRTGNETGSFREGHEFLASDSAFFTDNKRLLTSAVDNTVRIWDLSTGVELLRLDRTGRAAAVAVSHDDRWIVTGSDMRTAQMWDADSGKLVHVLDGHKVEVTAAAFSPDDRFVYTGDANGRGVLWDRATGKHLRRLGWHTSKIAAAVFLPDGSRLLTASDDKTVCQWDTQALADDVDSVVPLESLRMPHPDSVVSLDLSIDGTQAITACLDGHLRLWNVANAKLQRDLQASDSPATSAALSRDGRLAISVHADDRVVRLWNLETGRPVPGVDRPGSDVFLDFNQLGGLVWSARLTNDGAAVLTVGGNEARLWDIRREVPDARKREIMSFRPHAAVASAHFSPDGTRIVTASWDNSARVWDAETGRSVLHLVGGHSGYVNSAVFSPQGEFVLTASDDRTAKLWDAETGKVLRSFEGHQSRVRFATFSADGQLVLTASEDKTARIWRTQTAELVCELAGHKWGVLAAAFSADGRFVITGSDDNSAQVWNAQTGEALEALNGHTAAVTSVAFSPDGERALTASEDFTAKLWDTRTGKEILNLRGHSQEVTSVTFSDDGRLALTGSRDGTAILWLTEEWMQPVPSE